MLAPSVCDFVHRVVSLGLFAPGPSVCDFVHGVVSLQVASPAYHQFSTCVLSQVSAGVSLELFPGGPVQPAGGLH